MGGRMACAVVVDDDPVVRALTVRLLERMGCGAQAYATADEALAALAGSEHPPRLVITDVQMPGTLDGVDLARHAHTVVPGTPVVVVSACEDSWSAARAVPSVVEVLAKPYDPAELTELVHAIFGRTPSGCRNVPCGRMRTLVP